MVNREPLGASPLSRRRFLARAAASVGTAGIGCVVYAIGVEPHWLEIVERDLPVENLPPALAGARLVQISDLHIGPQVSDEYITRSLERAHALKPDIVVMTGDFITYVKSRGEAQFVQLRSVLAGFPQGRLATVGILGNHDYGRAWKEPDVASRVTGEAKRAGIRILRNESHSVAGLDIIGVDDLWATRCDPTTALQSRENAASIVLVHNPDAADVLPWPSYRGWMLAGHTHGGQCKPPFLPPPLLPVKNRRYVAGAVSIDATRTLYISRGVGHLIRARFNVRPEITSFTLRAAATT